MVYDDFGKKLKKVKARSKITPSTRLRVITIIAGIISIVIISFIVFNLYHMEMEKRAEELNKAKAAAINSTIRMFLNYSDDPHLEAYIVKIEGSTSIEEINKIVEEAARYIEFRKYKDNVINTIKNIYGEYYSENLYAQSIVYKIQKASSKEEIERILRESNIEENARRYFIEKMKNRIDPDKYYVIPVFKKKRLMKGVEVINYVKRLSLDEIKKILKEIEPVSFNKVAIVVPAIQCGKVPFEGSKIEIYNRKNNSMEPIPGIVNSSYVIVGNVEYKELITYLGAYGKVSYGIGTQGIGVYGAGYAAGGGDALAVQGAGVYGAGYGTGAAKGTYNTTVQGIEYSLENIPGILHATAAGRLNYSKVIKKLGKYGEKLNNITSATQIFDENSKYLLIVQVSSVDIPRLLSIPNRDIYIAVVE